MNEPVVSTPQTVGDDPFAAPYCLRAMLDTSPDIMVLKDTELRYRAVNAAFLRFVGLDEGQVLGRDDFALFPTSEAHRYQSGDREVLTQGRIVMRDERVSGAAGQRWLQVAKAPFHGPDGAIAGVLVTVRDIDEHKALEAELRERNQRLQTVLDNIPVMIAFYDAATQVTYLNRFCEQTVGWSSADANQRDLMTLLYPDPAYRREVQRYMANPRVEWRRITMRTRGGDAVESAWSNVALENGSYIGIGIDLRERLAVESALHTSEKRLRLITESIEDVFWMGTPGMGELLYVSRAYERVWGRSLESLYREPQSFLRAIHDEERAAVGATIARCQSEGRPYSLEYRVVDPLGAIRWVRDRAFPVREDGTVVAYAGVCTDITEQREAHAAVHRLNASLEQRVAERTAALRAASEELEAFSHSVAHDLRAPLRAINSYAGMLQEEYAETLAGDGTDLLERLRGTSVRMSQLIEGLLFLAQTGRAELALQAVDLGGLAREIAEELQAAEPERPVAWTIPAEALVRGDPALLRALLQNLLHNAWKFTAGRRPACIEVICERQPGRVLCRIGDNGVGFASEHAARLFRPFQRLHGAEYAGHGIGLATVRRIVERHGGEVWAESAPEEGTRVYFTLAGDTAAQ